MISKEQFLTIKRLKQEGVPIAAIARRIGISEPTTRKWANMSEAGFDELKKDDIPYLYNYREVILASCGCVRKQERPTSCTDWGRNFRTLSAERLPFTST